MNSISDCRVGFIVGSGVSYSDQGNCIITTECLVGTNWFCADYINDELSVISRLTLFRTVETKNLQEHSR